MINISIHVDSEIITFKLIITDITYIFNVNYIIILLSDSPCLLNVRLLIFVDHLLFPHYHLAIRRHYQNFQ